MPNEVMRDRYYSNIRSKLSFLVTEIRLDNSVNLQALNIHAENIYAGVLNILYGWSLKNANAVQQNAAGIDLFDADNKVVVQVSSKHTHKKIQEESIDKIAKQTVGDGDPTPKYEGYHYYFLAIAKDAKTTKAFTVPSWLTFDYKNDILDLTTLLSRVLSASAETQQKLSDFLDREMSSEAATRRMKTVAENTPLLQRNPFRYDSETVSFVGREVEMERLLSFLEGDAPFKWWAIVGPGGSGKTRLAYELKKIAEVDGEWTVEFLNESIYSEIEMLSNRQLNVDYPHRTLFVADHVQQHTSELGRWMNRLAAPDFRRTEPIRLLLIERNSGYENERYPWEIQIYNAARSARNVQNNCFDKPLSLRRLDADNHTEAIVEIMKSFAVSLRIRDLACPELPEEVFPKLVKQLQKIDKDMVRPLFAMFLVDAHLHSPGSMKNWTRDGLLEEIVLREYDLLKGAIMNLRPQEALNERLYAQCLSVWRLATVLGSYEDCKIELLQDICQDEWTSFERCAAGYNLMHAEDILKRIGLINKEVFIALRPNMLGEYMVLHWLRNEGASKKEKQRFFSKLLKTPGSAAFFYKNLLTDYYQLPDQGMGMLDDILPEGAEMSVKELSAYADFLQRLVYLSTDKNCRSYLTKKASDLCESEKVDAPELISMLIDTGYMYDALGKYSEAFDRCKSAEAVSQRISPVDETLHMSLIDLRALVCEHDGRYQEAIQEYRKLSYEEGSQELTDWYHQLATCYYNIENFIEFKNYVLKAINNELKQEHCLPDSHYRILSDLAMVNYLDGRYEKAILIDQEVAEAYEIIYGENHPNTAAIYGKLANYYNDNQDIPKALELFNRALRIQEAALGDDHPETSMTYNNIGMIYMHIGDYPLALEYFNKAKKIREKSLQAEHKYTATIYNNIGMVYHHMRDWDHAESNYKKAKDIREKHLEGSLDLASTYHNLGFLYKDRGEYKDAERFMLKAYSIRKRSVGLRHLDTANSCTNLSLLYLNTPTPDYNKAMRYAKEAMSVMINLYGEKSLQAGRAAVDIGNVFLAQKKLKPAIHWYEEYLKSLKRNRPPDEIEISTMESILQNLKAQIK